MDPIKTTQVSPVLYAPPMDVALNAIEPALVEPSPRAFVGLSGLMADVHALLAKQRDEGESTGVAEVHEKDRERQLATKRMNEALAEAKREHEDEGFFDSIADVFEIAAIAASALATVATAGATAPVLVGVAAMTFAELETKTHFMESLGADKETAEGAVLGANVLSLVMTIGGSIGNVTNQAGSSSVWGGEALKISSAVEDRLKVVERVGGSSLLGSGLALSGSAVGSYFSPETQVGKRTWVGDSAEAASGASKALTSFSKMAAAEHRRDGELADADVERKRTERDRIAGEQDAMIETIQSATEEWQRALEALAKSIHRVDEASHMMASMRA